MTAERINIAFGLDAGYVPHVAAVISSIVHNAPGASLRFIMLTPGIPDADRQRLQAVAPGAVFDWQMIRDEDLPDFATRGHFNRAILFRLGLEHLAPADCHRVLYIDGDTIVTGDIRELWNADLNGATIGAIRDRFISADDFAAKWQLAPQKARYFNSGVMVIDLDKVRASKAFSAAGDWLSKNGADILFGDQDALNQHFWNQWTELDPAWNVQHPETRAETAAMPEAARHWRRPAPGLIHYTGPIKPWMPNVWHPWAWLYWESLARTPFAREVAATNHMGLYQKLRLRLRWMLRRPNMSAS